jgi:hypothetical protein
VATLSPGRAYDAGVALDPSGRLYYVAHPDEPILEVVDVFAPGFERLHRTVVTEGGSSDGTSSSTWLGISPDGGRLYSRRANSPVLASNWPMQVVDTRTWTVATFDPQAAYLEFSPNGQWLYAVAPLAGLCPGGLLPPAIFLGACGMLFAPSMTANSGLGLRILDGASGRQLSSISHGQVVFQVWPGPANRLYAFLLPAADATGLPTPRVVSTGFGAADLVVYEAGTWRELARRSWQSPMWLVQASQ